MIVNGCQSNLNLAKLEKTGIVHDLNKARHICVQIDIRDFSLLIKSCGSLPDYLIQNLALIVINQELEYLALKLLEQQPELTQRQLSEALGVSLGKTNYVLKSLIDVGWVKLDNFQRSDNKWGYAYLLTPSGLTEKAAITVRFLKRKQQEYDDLQIEIAQLQKEDQLQQDLQ